MSKSAKLKKGIVATHPSSPFLRLQNEVDKLFNDFSDFFSPTRFQSWEQFENIALAPSMDVVEDETQYSVQLEMPGMDEKDIHVSIADNLLTVTGEKSTSQKNENKKYISREISYGKYERSISLPSTVDLDKSKATFKKGMLWIQLPKKAQGHGGARDLKIEHL